MKKILFLASIALLLGIGLSSAITQQEISEAKGLIDSKITCDKLTDNQLERIGEYYIEQMHTGNSHVQMHKVMGIQEGSDAERQLHINMAKTIYCGESGGMMGSGGMMNMMMGNNMMGGGTIGNYQTYGFGLNTMYVILVFGLIILVYLGIIKLWKGDLFQGKRK